MKFDVRYYLIAILFIIFDLEIAFVIPVHGGARHVRRVRPDRNGHLHWPLGPRFHLRLEEGALEWE